MLIFRRYVIWGVFFILFAGCASVEPSSREPQKETAVNENVADTPDDEEMTTADFNKAVQSLVRNLAKSGVLTTKDNEKGKVRISRFTDMTKKFDANVIRRDVQTALRSTKSAVVLSLVVKKEEIPDFTLSGRITSRIAYVRGRQRTEYYLHLTLADAKTGVNLWESDTVVLKNKQKN